MCFHGKCNSFFMTIITCPNNEYDEDEDCDEIIEIFKC